MNELEVHIGDSVQFKDGKVVRIHRMIFKGDKTFLYFRDSEQREHAIPQDDVSMIFYCPHKKGPSL